jgi:hypothetical protein
VVKAHYESVGREGNIVADILSENALKVETVSSLWKGILTELPAWVNSLDGDAHEEALWRLNKSFFRWGRGTCWIAPTFSNGNGIESANIDEEEED